MFTAPNQLAHRTRERQKALKTAYYEMMDSHSLNTYREPHQ